MLRPHLHNVLFLLLVNIQLNGFHSTSLPLRKVVSVNLWYLSTVQAKYMEICPKGSALKLHQFFPLPANVAALLPPTAYSTLGIRLQ